MKIVFLASIEGIKEYKDTYLAIIDYLQRKNHTVEHTLSVTEEILLSWSLQKREMFFAAFHKEITKADLVIAECSLPSITLGYEISSAVQQGKEVIALKSSSSIYQISQTDPLYSNKNIYIYEYTIPSLGRIIHEALQLTHNEPYKKFNILLPVPMAAKLTMVTKNKNLPKSVYIRNLITSRYSSDSSRNSR
ncbi:MAG: hypothetical protein AAB553_00495 [Patescibacteria group bacterium]